MADDKLPRDETDGTLQSYAWPGCYPLYYVTKDGGTLCPTCARMAEREKLTGDHDEPQWCIVAAEANWEDPALYCDHCYERIESAYAEPEDSTD